MFLMFNYLYTHTQHTRTAHTHTHTQSAHTHTQSTHTHTEHTHAHTHTHCTRRATNRYKLLLSELTTINGITFLCFRFQPL
jgi:hypothetical protein